MNEIIRALKVLKENCIKNGETCIKNGNGEKCCFYDIDEGCYLFKRIPEEYDALELEVN